MREAIVLAGGFGTRLREIVPDWPKPMAPVAGRPFLEFVLEVLVANGFSRTVLSLGFMAEKILNYYGSQFCGMKLDYIIEEFPLGTGGAVRLAMTRCTQDHVFVLNGDTFLEFDADSVDAQWVVRGNPIILARQVSDTSRYGRLLVQDGLVNGFTEKGVSGPGLINAGCYVLKPTQLDMFPLNKTFSLEADFLAGAIQKIPVEVHVTNGRFIDIGIPEDYERAQLEFAAR